VGGWGGGEDLTELGVEIKRVRAGARAVSDASSNHTARHGEWGGVRWEYGGA
jgi:hypothetical protein